MKTSNQLLVITSVSALGIFGLAHLALYGEYKQGNIIPETQLRNEQFRRYDLPEPQYLFIQGLLFVTIIPSDTFHIELENKDVPSMGPKASLLGEETGDPPQPTYRIAGDTLLIMGARASKIARTLDPELPWNFPQVNIYCRNVPAILVENGQVFLKGSVRHAPGFRQLQLRDAICGVGKRPAGGNEQEHPDNFDTLRIDAANSVVVLNQPANIRSLSMRMDNRSELRDRNAEIGKISLDCADKAVIILSGKNQKKINSCN